MSEKIGYIGEDGQFHEVTGYLFAVQKREDLEGEYDGADAIMQVRCNGELDGVPMGIHAAAMKGLYDGLKGRIAQIFPDYLAAINELEDEEEDEEEIVEEQPLRKIDCANMPTDEQIAKSIYAEFVPVVDPENKELDSYLGRIIREEKSKRDAQSK